MARASSDREIIDLTIASDHDADYGFENLRAAASRAQHAASRYLKHTMSLSLPHSSQDRGSSVSLEMKLERLIKNEKRPISHLLTASPNPKNDSLDIENTTSHKDVLQDRGARIASSDSPRLPPTAIDSGLGESISETEDSRLASHSPVISLSPQPGLAVVHKTTESQSTTAPNFEPLSMLSPAATGGSQALASGQIHGHVSKKRGRSQTCDRWSILDLEGDDIIAWKNLKTSQMSGDVTSKTMDTNHPLHQTQLDLSAPKRRGRPHKSNLEADAHQTPEMGGPQTSAFKKERTLEYTNISSQYPAIDRSYAGPSVSKPNIKKPRSSLPHLGPFKKNHIIADSDSTWSRSLQTLVAPPKIASIDHGHRRDSSLVHRDSKCNNSLQELLMKSLYLTNKADPALADIVKELIYPALKNAVADLKGLLSEAKLMSIAKTVSSPTNSDHMSTNDDSDL